MLAYLLAAIALSIIVGVIYANWKQARVTVTFSAPEPDVDLSYRPPVPPEESESKEIVSKPRDPHLAQLSQEELIMEVLKECYDPEIPLNIVDLGLVYNVKLEKDAVQVKMSLTAPGCPSTGEITQDVQSKLSEAGFSNPQVEIVWDPPWTAQRISEEGRKTLGI